MAGSATSAPAPKRRDEWASGGQHHARVTATPMTQRQPDPVDALGERAAQVAGAEAPGHRGRGAVGQEDAQPDERLEHGRSDAEAGQLGGAEVADDGGVGEQEQRLGDQGHEGRQGQPPDLPVVAPVEPCRLRGAGAACRGQL